MIMKDVRMNLSRAEEEKIYKNADVDGDSTINFEEFVACIIDLATRNQEFQRQESKASSGGSSPPRRRQSMLAADQQVQAVEAAMGGGDDDDEEDGDEEEDVPEDLADLEPEEQQRRIKMRALVKTGVGTLLVLVFSDPAVDLLAEIGSRLHISPFYVAFVLSPIASNA